MSKYLALFYRQLKFRLINSLTFYIYTYITVWLVKGKKLFNESTHLMT